MDADNTYGKADIPICSVCDNISLECSSLSACSHPACPKCVAMVSLGTTVLTTCKVCAQQPKQRSADISENHDQADESKCDGGLPTGTPGEPNNTERDLRNKKLITRQDRVEESATVSPRSETQLHSLRDKAQGLRHQDRTSAEKVDEISILGRTEAAAVPGRRLPNAPAMTSVVRAYLEEAERSDELSDSVAKIQEAMMLATKYSHCSNCLQDKKSRSPDLLCLDCSLSFCTRCGGRHKCLDNCKEHIMVPVEGRRNSANRTSKSQAPFCPTHSGFDLAMYCSNCETLVCRECVVAEHLDCPGVITAQQYASQEREITRLCRTRHSQVMSFFSEQRRNTEETMAALKTRKKDLQDHIRKFFSTLMKACMDVEAHLLEELETPVSDHTDLLEQQSAQWLQLQERMQQLLDITDTLHFLPTADFLPLCLASKESLSQALREGESLAAATPSHMSLALSLEQSSQRSVIKRIIEIGASALTVSTHDSLILRKVTSTSFKAACDQKEPHVTGMALLAQTVLVAADFNNSCLKLLKVEREEGAEDCWNVEQVLPLKWPPFSVTPLPSASSSPKSASSDPNSLPSDKDTKHSTLTRHAKDEMTESMDSLVAGRRGISLERQSAVMVEEDDLTFAETTVLQVQVAVTSPFAGCFVVSVPLSGKHKLKVVRPISEEKGYWGLAAIDDHTIAASTVDAGRCFISLLETGKNFKRRLPLTSATSTTPLVAPRHILATSPSTMLVCDHGKKAAIHVSTEGQILFVYTGHGNKRLARPEGLCMDSMGHVYIADSGDDSVSVLTTGGTLSCKTTSQQSDLSCPQAVCVDRNGCLYVSNDGGKLLSIYDIM